jgi:type I restriction enzyme S subunit
MSATELPPGWQRVRFGDVVRKVSDRVDPETAGIERYVAGEHMDTDDVRIRRWGEVGDGYLGPAFHMRFQPGQVLYGSRRTYLRKVAVPDFEGICANTTFVLESSSEDLLPEFLPLLMTTERFHEHSIKQSKGSVNPYINFSDLVWYEFMLPPPDEQLSIAASLRAVDRALETQSCLGHSARQLCSALFAELTSGSPRVLLSEVCSIDLGRQRSPKFASGPNMLPYIRAANVKHGRLLLDDVLSMHFDANEVARLRLEPGDVLVTEGCGSLDEIGANAVWGEELEGDVCFQNTVLRLRTKDHRLEQGFLQEWASHAFFSGQFARIASGTSIYHLGSRRTERMEIPLPDLDTQTRVLDQVQRARELADIASTTAERLAKCRQALMQKLFSGGTKDVQ